MIETLKTFIKEQLQNTKEYLVEYTPEKLANSKTYAALYIANTALAEQLEKLSVTVSMKAGEGGRAFGSVSGKEISKAIKDQLKMDIDKKKFLLPEPLKTFGTHEVPIKLHKDVTAKLAVKVVEA